jgi:hypothetical protein
VNVTTLPSVTKAHRSVRRRYIGTHDTDPRWRDREVRVLFRSKGPGPRNALVEFDTGERVVVPTYAGGRGSTLRVPPRVG